MARYPRLDLPGIPQHIVQRGNNRAACFFCDAHRRFYLDLLRDASRAAGVAIHAYVLMGNHVHILATPTDVGAVSVMMQVLGRRYVQSVNKARGRTGTLFDGRFKSGLVQSERYLLCCYRYIELNPVRAALVVDPSHYRWSSYDCNALGEPDGVITRHAVFDELGESPAARQLSYRDFVAQGMPADEHEAIRSHARQGRALGTTDFQAWVESVTGRPAAIAPRGRPRRKWIRPHLAKEKWI
jgi:putative transposase